MVTHDKLERAAQKTPSTVEFIESQDNPAAYSFTSLSSAGGHISVQTNDNGVGIYRGVGRHRCLKSLSDWDLGLLRSYDTVQEHAKYTC